MPLDIVMKYNRLLWWQVIMGENGRFTGCTISMLGRLQSLRRWSFLIKPSFTSGNLCWSGPACIPCAGRAHTHTHTQICVQVSSLHSHPPCCRCIVVMAGLTATCCSPLWKRELVSPVSYNMTSTRVTKDVRICVCVGCWINGTREQPASYL